jgi:hypothetical protein
MNNIANELEKLKNGEDPQLIKNLTHPSALLFLCERPASDLLLLIMVL